MTPPSAFPPSGPLLPESPSSPPFSPGDNRRATTLIEDYRATSFSKFPPPFPFRPFFSSHLTPSLLFLFLLQPAWANKSPTTKGCVNREKVLSLLGTARSLALYDSCPLVFFYIVLPHVMFRAPTFVFFCFFFFFGFVGLVLCLFFFFYEFLPLDTFQSSPCTLFFFPNSSFLTPAFSISWNLSPIKAWPRFFFFIIPSGILFHALLLGFTVRWPPISGDYLES